VQSFKIGRPPLFHKQQEEFLIDYIQTLARWGYPLNKDAVKHLAREYASVNDIQRNGKEWVPGEDWLKEFRNRHKDTLGLRLKNTISRQRACSLNEKSLGLFYDILKGEMDSLDLHNKPQNVFNCDESGFQSFGSRSKVFCSKKDANVHDLAVNNEKQSYTVQICADACGNFLSHYVLFKGNYLN